MSRLRTIALGMSAALASLCGQLNANNWEKAKEDQGVVVYTRSVDNSQMKEFRAQTLINAPAHKILDVLINFAAYPQWVYNYQGTQQIKKISESEYIYYTVISAPWPVTNRDLVVRLVQQKTDYGYKITISADNTIMKPKPDLVRMVTFKGTWELHQKGNSTEVISQIHGDPSGMIPSWLANSIMVDGPISTLSSMHQMVKK